MKLLLVCAKCMQDDIEHAWTGLIEPNSEGFYKIVCSKGHESFHVPQETDFEILFEIGCYAIIDGYYREAISSYSAALERFYAFCIEIISRRHNVSPQILKEAWKKISNQSERQLGAFIYLWLVERKETPDILTDNEKKFRNDVIHKGKIPNKEEAIIFGQRVLNIISSQIDIIKENYKEELILTIRELQTQRNLNIPNDAFKTFGVQGLTLSLTAEKNNNLDLAKELKKIARKREGFNRTVTQ